MLVIPNMDLFFQAINVTNIITHVEKQKKMLDKEIFLSEARLWRETKIIYQVAINNN